MCNEFKSKKDIGFFRFALGFSNRNLTEIYTQLEVKNSATYSLEGHAQFNQFNSARLNNLGRPSFELGSAHEKIGV